MRSSGTKATISIVRAVGIGRWGQVLVGDRDHRAVGVLVGLADLVLGDLAVLQFADLAVGMRPPSSVWIWRKETAWLSVAFTSLTGMLTRPKEMAPFQMDRTCSTLSRSADPPRDRRAICYVFREILMVWRLSQRWRGDGSPSATWTRCCIPRPASPRASCCTTTRRPPRCCCRTCGTGRCPSCGTGRSGRPGVLHRTCRWVRPTGSPRPRCPGRRSRRGWCWCRTWRP